MRLDQIEIQILAFEVSVDGLSTAALRSSS